RSGSADSRTETYLDALAPAGIKLGLERVQTLLAALGRPERGYPAIHGVGTNRKASTVRFCPAALQTSGRRVGPYLSPAVAALARALGALGVRRLEAVAVGAAPGLARGRVGAVNAALALLLARIQLGHEGLDEDAAREAIRAAALPGRVEVVEGDPPLLL